MNSSFILPHGSSISNNEADNGAGIYNECVSGVLTVTNSTTIGGLGIGNTASALTDSNSLESIDVVDISSDIMELSKVVYNGPAAFPLHDERVKVHVEDGRFFLQTTAKKFDLITGEPPPPTIAGVVNLYTQEHFELIHARLNSGGFASY